MKNETMEMRVNITKSDKDLIKDMKLDIIRFISLSDSDHKFYEWENHYHGKWLVFADQSSKCQIVIETGVCFNGTSSVVNELPFLKNDDYFKDSDYTVEELVPGKNWWNSPYMDIFTKTRRVFRFSKELSEFLHKAKKISDKHKEIESKERYNKLLEKYKDVL